MTKTSTPLLGAALLALGAAPAMAGADLEAGRMIFTETAQPACAVCHALADAQAEAEIGPNLDAFNPTVEQVRAAVTSGIGVMPAFAETLSAEEIETVAQYVAQVTGGAAASSSAAVPESAAAPAGAASDAPMPGAEILARGDADAGEKIFRKCTACHTAEDGGANRVGPNLHGIVGAPVAMVEGFRYSDALSAYGGDWTPDRLAAFLADPRAEVPGTRMGFAGLRKDQDQADVIAYLAKIAEAAKPD